MEDAMGDYWLRCNVSRGQFAEEYVVELRDFQNRLSSLFVPAEYVEAECDPRCAESCQGWLRVELLERERDLALVRLPTTPMENGPTVTVRANEIDVRLAAEPA